MIATTSLRHFCEHVYFADADDLAFRTRQAFRYTLNRWERTTSNPPVKQIDDGTLRSFRDGSRDLAPASINSHWFAIRVLLNHARRRGIIDIVPYLRTLRHRSLLRPVPTLHNLGQCYAAADVAIWPTLHVSPAVFWRSFLVTSYFTGLRLSDLMFSLTWSGVRADHVEVIAHKTGKLHLFPLSPVFARHLKRIRPQNPAPTDRVFPVSKSPHLIRRELRRLSAAASVPAITPHALRRLAGTEWESARDGAGRLLLGHSMGASDHYIAVPRLLTRALPDLRIPPEFGS